MGRTERSRCGLPNYFASRQISAEQSEVCGLPHFNPKMASGVRFGARFCSRAYASSFCYSRASRINVRYLRRCRKACIANAIEVSTKRFYADENSSRTSDALKFSQYLMQENFRNTTVDIDDSSFTDFEGEQDNEDPSVQMMMERYEKYRTWLANLMGKDPESFDQEAVQEAIEYLLPSGLYAKDCRPSFEHPQSLYRQSTEQSFKMDKHGRPLAAAFYTGQVAFHDLLFEIYELTAKLNALDETAPSDSGATEKGDILTSGDDTESQSSDVDSAGSSDSDSSAGEDHSSSSDESESHASDVQIEDNSDDDTRKENLNLNQKRMRWISKNELEMQISELLSDRDYEVVLHRLRKLTKHRNVDHAIPFLLSFLREIPLPGKKEAVKELNEDGEAYGEGDRKNAVARVWVKKGSGQVTVNDVPFVKYFPRMEDRKQIMSPFLAINAVGDYDVRSEVLGGGHSGQSGAIRLALSRALLNFEDSYLEPLEEAHLLIRDPRIKERKKPGQMRARRKFAWVKR